MPPFRKTVETIKIPFVIVYSSEGKIISEVECFSETDAKTKQIKLLSEGKCAVIKEKRIPYDDYIPF